MQVLLRDRTEKELDAWEMTFKGTGLEGFGSRWTTRCKSEMSPHDTHPLETWPLFGLTLVSECILSVLRFFRFFLQKALWNGTEHTRPSAALPPSHLTWALDEL